MKIQQLLTDDEAVSPVIGVILMVAITVILAAVIGAFVLGIGGDQSVAPQASWSISETTDEITFTHEGGDSIEVDNLAMTATSDVFTDDGGTETDRLEGSQDDFDTPSSSETVTAGVDVEAGFDSSTDPTNDDTVRIIWSDPGSDDTSVLRTHDLSNQ